MKNNPFKSGLPPNGFTILEMVVALFLLTVCLVAFSQLVVFVTTQRVAEGTRQAAVDQLQNVFEQLSDLPDEKLAALDFDDSDYQETARRAVPDGRIEFSCNAVPWNEAEAPEVRSRLFQAALSWDRGENRPRGTVSLFRLLTLAQEGEPVR